MEGVACVSYNQYGVFILTFACPIDLFGASKVSYRHHTTQHNTQATHHAQNTTKHIKHRWPLPFKTFFESGDPVPSILFHFRDRGDPNQRTLSYSGGSRRSAYNILIEWGSSGSQKKLVDRRVLSSTAVWEYPNRHRPSNTRGRLSRTRGPDFPPLKNWRMGPRVLKNVVGWDDGHSQSLHFGMPGRA